MADILRHRLFLLGAVVGLILGLLIGWVIWPVHYANAYPSDLRAADKVDYILLVSREFQRTGDYEALARRLSTFPKKVLPQVFTMAKKAYAANPQYARDIEQTWAFVRTNSASPMPTPSAATATVGPTGGIKGKILPWLGVLVGLGIILYALRRLYQWVTLMREAPPTPLSREYETDSYPEEGEEGGEGPVEREEPAPVAAEPSPAPATSTSSVGATSPPASEAPTSLSSPTPAHRPPLRVLTEPAAPTIRLVQVFQPVYMLQAQEEEAYDEAFTVRDEADKNIGECGVGEAEQFQDQAGRPTVMEVWLFDKYDTVTRQGFILSPWASKQPDIRRKYEESGRVLVAKPGAVVRLTAKSLYLEGEIKDVAFAQLGNGDEVFSKLALEMKVFKRLGGQGDGRSQ